MSKNKKYLILGAIVVAGGALFAADHQILSMTALACAVGFAFFGEL